ncbi:VWA domain-containing protein [Neomegalonema sp.]|uniref:VWA domain-containing protein n=1 Tax=Neomegalonema sp. TaxID=2039713 RepID=UPI00261E5C73|nr:VWA domain-containing protein [Neomegalonema sp.]MDD2869762.1 VWA domain-containing protein [Neomegalonema sp.]
MRSPVSARLAPPLAAAAFALTAALGPSLPLQRDLRDALITVDVTRSMNVRDMNGLSRLEAAHAALRLWIADQPCGTRVGLAIFTERRSLTLFEPVEVCADFATLSAALAALDWRMAWEGDSMISRGLDHALKRAEELKAGLIFVTDGHEAPPLPYSGPNRFAGESPGGVILGVGGDTPSPIPKFDDLGREAGFYGPHDVQHAPARVGPPPADAESRPGFHPRNNPYGEADLEGAEHLSALRADHLQELAAGRGLVFLRLSEGPQALSAAFAAPKAAGTGARMRRIPAPFDLSPFFGALALLALLVGWFAPSGLRSSPSASGDSS